MDGDRNRSERIAKLVQPRDVVEVGVREQDRLDIRLAVARSVDDELRLEVGVDHHRIVRVLVLDEVRVRAEPAVGGDLDVQPQRFFLTTRYRSVSR